MLKWFASLPVRKRVGLLAILLGIIAIFAKDPYDKATTRVNLKDITLSASKAVNKISAKELADWIIKGRYDYRLIDLRKPEDYARYNIPTSENIPIGQLLNSDLLRNEKIVLYSNDEYLASQAWFILRADNYDGVYILKGGLKCWEDEVLFPKLPPNPNEEQLAEFEKAKQVSKFFGGHPIIGGKEIAENRVERPVLKAPPKVVIKKRHKKKVREGC